MGIFSYRPQPPVGKPNLPFSGGGGPKPKLGPPKHPFFCFGILFYGIFSGGRLLFLGTKIKVGRPGRGKSGPTMGNANRKRELMSPSPRPEKTLFPEMGIEVGAVLPDCFFFGPAQGFPFQLFGPFLANRVLEPPRFPKFRFHNG